MNGNIQDYRLRVQQAITDPFSPPPNISEIMDMLGAGKAPSFDEIRQQYLSSAPEFAVNFYRNLRTPEGAQNFFQMAFRYPKTAQRLLGVVRMFIPFVLPAEEMQARLEWNEKIRDDTNEKFARALSIHNTIMGWREQKLADIVDGLITRFGVATDPETFARLWQDMSRFVGTPYYDKIYPNAVLSATRIMRLRPETQLWFQRNLPPDVYNAAMTMVINERKYQEFLARMMDIYITEAEQFLEGLREFGLDDKMLEAAIGAAKEFSQLVATIPREELDVKMENISKQLLSAITTASYKAKPTIGTMINQFTQLVTGLINQIGTGTTQTVNQAMSEFSRFANIVGGRVTTTLEVDNQGKVLLTSWEKILDELEEKVKRMIDRLAKTGLYPTETLEILLSHIQAKKGVVRFGRQMLTDLQNVMNTPEVTNLLSKAAQQQLTQKLRRAQLDTALTRLAGLRQELQSKQWKSEYDKLHRFFQDTRGYLQTISSWLKTLTPRDLTDKDVTSVLRSALNMARIAANPETARYLGPGVDEQLRSRILADIDAALAQLNQAEGKHASPQQLQGLLNHLNNLVPRLLNILDQTYTAMYNLLQAQNILPTTSSLPPSALQYGGLLPYIGQQQAQPEIHIHVEGAQQGQQPVPIMPAPYGGQYIGDPTWATGGGVTGETKGKKQTTQTPVKPTIQPTTKPITKPTTQPTTKPTAKPTTKPTTQTPISGRRRTTSRPEQKTFWQRLMEFLEKHPGFIY